jgi:hypothetical protein
MQILIYTENPSPDSSGNTAKLLVPHNFADCNVQLEIAPKKIIN